MNTKPVRRNKKIEHNVQSAIHGYLAYSGWLVWRNNVGAVRAGNRFVRFGKVGSGDLFAVKDGKFLSVEVKKPKGKPTENQLLWLEDIRLHGGLAVIAHSVQEVVDYLIASTLRDS